MSTNYGPNYIILFLLKIKKKNCKETFYIVQQTIQSHNAIFLRNAQ